MKDGGHLRRLVKDEEHLRREHDLINNMEDKELMILLQQRKIAALDEANTRWVNVFFGMDVFGALFWNIEILSIVLFG